MLPAHRPKIRVARAFSVPLPASAGSPRYGVLSRAREQAILPLQQVTSMTRISLPAQIFSPPRICISHGGLIGWHVYVLE